MKNLKTILIIAVAFMASLSESTAAKGDAYFFSKTLNGTMDEVQQKTVEALKTVGFGVVSEMNMHEKLNEKLNTDLKPYRLLGVCNPKYAYDAIQQEENIGLFLPCKVLLKDKGNGQIEIVFADPAGMMKMVGDDALNKIADEVTGKLKKAFESIK